MKRARDSYPDPAWLTDALQEQAHGHEPDIERIKARFEHLTNEDAAPSTPRRQVSGPMRMRLRLLGIPLGIAVALASATVAVAVSVGIAVSAMPRPAVPVSSPKSTAAPSAVSASGSPSSGSTPAEGSTASSGAGRSGTTGPAGQLAAEGTVDTHSTRYWVQEDLTVTPTRTIRELRLTVTVSGGTSVASTGIWTTIAPADLETSVSRVPGGLEYVVTLKPGQSLGPAAYRFGFQFNRPASGHDFALDTYSITATDSEGTVLTASGEFGG